MNCRLPALLEKYRIFSRQQQLPSVGLSANKRMHHFSGLPHSLSRAKNSNLGYTFGPTTQILNYHGYISGYPSSVISMTGLSGIILLRTIWTSMSGSSKRCNIEPQTNLSTSWRPIGSGVCRGCPHSPPADIWGCMGNLDDCGDSQHIWLANFKLIFWFRITLLCGTQRSGQSHRTRIIFHLQITEVYYAVVRNMLALRYIFP